MKPFHFALSASAAAAMGAGAAIGVSSWIERREFEQVVARLDALAGRRAFSAEDIADLPAPVQRYLVHSVAEGTPRAAVAWIEQRARMRPKPGAPYFDLTAREILAPGVGFAWKAATRVGPVPMQILDRYVARRGSVRGSLFGVVRVMGDDSEDAARSSRHRLAAESMWVPSALMTSDALHWEAIGDHEIVATHTVDGEDIPVTLHIGDSGSVQRLEMRRYGNVGQPHFGLIPYGFEVTSEATFGGHTIPVTMRGGWWFGTERFDPEGASEFELVDAVYH